MAQSGRGLSGLHIHYSTEFERAPADLLQQESRVCNVAGARLLPVLIVESSVRLPPPLLRNFI